MSVEIDIDGPTLPDGHDPEKAAAARAQLSLTAALFEGFPAAITVTDRIGIIVAMNANARTNYVKSGGGNLIGRNVLDCHPGESRNKMAALLKNAGTNSYIIEKGGERKMVHQCPWFRGGEYAGIVEVAFAIPSELPVHKRG
jgi:transcriptional regulator with PAS, ATPase and Fis domain